MVFAEFSCALWGRLIIISIMFASNNKPSKRSARAERGHGSHAQLARDSRTRRRGSDAYGASNYGDSTYRSTTHQNARRGAGYSAVDGSSRRGVHGAYSGNSNRGMYGAADGSYGNGGSGRRSSFSHDRELIANQRARKKKRRKRILITTLSIVFVLLLTGVGAAWAYMNSINDALNKNVDSDLLNSLSVTDSASDPFYMLLIGIDKSEERESSNEYGGAYRTDSMILARVDPKEKKVTLISIPRDTQVTIGSHGTQKINAAYAFGGPSGAVNAVESLAGVSISHYAEIDFDGFAAVVDSLGGIDIDVQYEINDEDYTGYLAAGQQTLNGEQALIYCRSRHAYDKIGDGDAIRAANQRTMISAIVKKLMSSDIATLTNTVSTLSQYITTDYSVSGILGLAQSMMGIDVENNVYSAAVPTESVYENNVWYEKVQKTSWEKMISRVKQGLSPTEEDVVDKASGTVMASSGDGGSSSSSSSSSSSGSSDSLSGTKIAVKNGSGITSCASQAAAKLTPEGAVCETGNADDYNYKNTLIIYSGDNEAKAQKVSSLLGKGTVKKNDGTYSFTGDILVVVGKDWS